MAQYSIPLVTRGPMLYDGVLRKLYDSGVNVDILGQGQRALSMCRKEEYSLILLGMRLYEPASVVKFIGAVRRRGKNRYTHLVVLDRFYYMRHKTAERISSAGAEHVPYNPDSLDELTERILGMAKILQT